MQTVDFDSLCQEDNEILEVVLSLLAGKLR